MCGPAPATWPRPRRPAPASIASALPALHARAADARRPLPLLGDAHAGALVAALARAFTHPPPRARFASVVRNVVYDDAVRTFLRAHPGGTVVELGAGLDTRFERLDDGRARWIAIDLPAVTAVRRELMVASPRRVHVAASALALGWLDGLAPAGAATCVVCEALLGHLPVGQARALLGRLARRLPGATLVLDLPRRWPAAPASWAAPLAAARAIEGWGLGLALADATSFLARSPRPPRAGGLVAPPPEPPFVVATFEVRGAG